MRKLNVWLQYTHPALNNFYNSAVYHYVTYYKNILFIYKHAYATIRVKKKKPYNK